MLFSQLATSKGELCPSLQMAVALVKIWEFTNLYQALFAFGKQSRFKVFSYSSYVVCLVPSTSPRSRSSLSTPFRMLLKHFLEIAFYQTRSLRCFSRKNSRIRFDYLSLCYIAWIERAKKEDKYNFVLIFHLEIQVRTHFSQQLSPLFIDLTPPIIFSPDQSSLLEFLVPL